jgi:hypothetical protein
MAMRTDLEPGVARDLWRVIEPYHQLAYRSPEAQAAYAAIGLDRPELQYFGGRLAAMGPISVEIATAVLFGFAPAYVGRAVPEVWDHAAPAAIVEARALGAALTLDRVLGAAARSATMDEAAELGRRVAEAAGLAGRPLAAAHRSQAWPDDPALVLWHACTILREHRGDAHWAVTSAFGLDAVECHVLHAADGHMPDDMLQRVTGWDDGAWAAAWDRLRERGLVEDRTATAAGADLKAAIEHRTDDLAIQPFSAIGTDGCRRLAELMTPLAAAITASGIIGAWQLREELWRDLPPRRS